MRAFILILILLLGFPYDILGQKKEKIKGNKEVISISKEIKEPFERIEISDDVTVELQRGIRNSYTLTTDQNLIEEVAVEVQNEILKIYTKSKITNSKKLYLIITLESINSLIVNDNSLVKSAESLEINNLNIVLNNSSKIDLDLNIGQNIEIYFSDNAGGKITLNAKQILIDMKNRSDLKAKLIQCQNLEIRLKNSAGIKLDGDVDKSFYNVEGTSNLDAKKLKTRSAVLNSKNRTDIYVNAAKSIVIDAEGKSKIYIYGNPEIDLKGLTDHSRIIKK
ncbi:GIN domain-containing protein [Christiangramia echinicola]|uniref:Auto-transporter adhesin, head GIN domain n=1 Tax=Christiangramia echinicola TaxID=279359 RepID=A0A1H1LCM5_9FLAO|nr:DUF2807 domain-containing protein [Christiangramia echinicola]SDR72072.1 Putative auto-transporter adhesin, head GIN domain [Christiangramia echinicola]